MLMSPVLEHVQNFISFESSLQNPNAVPTEDDHLHSWFLRFVCSSLSFVFERHPSAQANSEKAASAVVLRGSTETKLLLVQKVLSFAVFAAYRLHFENAFLTDALSNATTATVSFGVEGLPETGNVECLKQVCKDTVQLSAYRTNLKRQIGDCVDAVSPHVTSWTTSRSHAAFEQISEYRKPAHAPCDVSCTKLEVQSDGDELSISALSTSSSMSASNSLNDSESDSQTGEETGGEKTTAVQIDDFAHRGHELRKDEVNKQSTPLALWRRCAIDCWSWQRALC